MSTSILYNLFGLRGYHINNITRQGGHTTVSVEPGRKHLCCSSCGSYRIAMAGSVERRLHSVPLGRRPVWLSVTIPRLLCADCGLTRQSRLTFAAARVCYTRAFARLVVDLARHMSLYAVATWLEVGWDLVKSIVKSHLYRKFARPRLKDVRRIAIDEIHLGRRFKFCTIVLDLDSGAVIYVGEGRNAAALQAFWPRLWASGAKIVAVATDMGLSYIAAARRYLPKAIHVLDRFHVVKLFNQVLDELRRAELKQARGQQRKLLTGTKWLLMKRPDNLDADRNEHERLRLALQANLNLMTAYYLGEDLNQFWMQPSKEKAEALLNDWYALAMVSGIGRVTRFAKTLLAFRESLLAWYDQPISTGPLESANGRIRLLQRRAYGYRDREFLVLRIYAMHDRVYA